MGRYEREFEKAEKDAEKFDLDDYFAHGINYFKCGCKKNLSVVYNYPFATALAIIGELYGTDIPGRNGNYHKGIAYLSNELGVHKRQIKILRKAFVYKNKYIYKIPYKVVPIVTKMIELLSANESKKIVKKFLKRQNSFVYREILIGKQYSEIEAVAKYDERIWQICNELTMLVKKVE